MSNAIEFAYEHYGRRVAPEAPLAWLLASGVSAKSGKIMSRPVGGSAVFISQSESMVFGIGYPHAGLRASTMKWAEFRDRLLFAPPEEPWMALSFGQAGVSPEALVLNISTAESVVAENSGKWMARSKPRVLAAFHGMTATIPEKKISRLLVLCHKQICNVVLSPFEAKEFNDLAPPGSEIRRIVSEGVELLLTHEVPHALVNRYLKWRGNHAHV